MFSRELNNANTVKRMADFLGHHLRIMKKIILILAAMLTLAACTKEGDVIYQTDPADAPSTTPLVTVIYDPNGVGDGNYNDLLYLETSEPLDGKGSTLCLPYYGAMYEGGAQAQPLAPTPTERDFIRRGCRGAAPAESVLCQYSDRGQTRYDSKH
jgi:hypothetical protein